MKKVSWLIGFFAALTIIAGCSTTSNPHGKDMPAPESFNAHFGDMDTDSDEMVNWEEFKAYFPQAESKVYAALDINKDGFIDHDEWHEFKAAHGLEHKE